MSANSIETNEQIETQMTPPVDVSPAPESPIEETKNAIQSAQASISNATEDAVQSAQSSIQSAQSSISNATEDAVQSTKSSLNNPEVQAFLNDPIGYTGAFLKPYTPILISIGYVLLGIVAIRLVFGLLGAILNVATSLPIVSPLLELVGIGYTGWFIYRYLLTSDRRQELSGKMSQIKQDFIGGSDA